MKKNNENHYIDSESMNQIISEAFELAQPAELQVLSSKTATAFMEQTKHFIGTMVQYKELMMMYTCAIKEVRTKFDVLNTDFNVRHQRNPIQFISSRLKRTASISEKLDKKALEFTIENIEQAIEDVAGIRIICAYIDDIYSLADSLICQDDITLIKRKDYIANPKPNGYRSLHLIVSVPVFFSEQKRDMKVEVQIRTIAMDFWASLEHQLKYKHIVPGEQEVIAKLKSCADVIAQTDKDMLDIRKQIELAADLPTEEDILLDKIKNIDVPII